MAKTPHLPDFSSLRIVSFVRRMILRRAWKKAQTATKAPLAVNERPLFNYIWINQNKFIFMPDGPLCGVPMENLRRAIANANMYPQADFILWLDTRLIDDSTRFFVDSAIHTMGRQRNISVRNLRDIDTYARNPVFNSRGPFLSDGRSGSGSVYVRADLARVLVLDHLMQAQPERRFVIYSDMDCKDVKLQQAVAVMQEHGSVMNKIPGLISHGYVGLDSHNQQVRAAFCDIPACATNLAVQGRLGWEAFELFSRRLYGGGYGGGGERADVARLSLLPEVGVTAEPAGWARHLNIS